MHGYQLFSDMFLLWATPALDKPAPGNWVRVMELTSCWQVHHQDGGRYSGIQNIYWQIQKRKCLSWAVLLTAATTVEREELGTERPADFSEIVKVFILPLLLWTPCLCSFEIQVLKPKPSVMLLRGGLWGGDESMVVEPHSGIKVLTKETLRSLWGHGKKMLSMNQGVVLTRHWILVLDFQPPNCEKLCLVFISPQFRVFCYGNQSRLRWNSIPKP